MKAMTPVKMLDVRLQDVIAAVEYVKKLPYVDTTRMAMSGLSVGGIETVLASEKGLGLKCFVPFAPGAMSWANRELRTREIAAIKAAKAPVFLLQAHNDFSLGPSKVLGAILKQKGSPNQSKVYSVYGVSHEDGHRNFALAGCDIWGDDVLRFLDANLNIHR
jgi:dienelactone hydrolase